MNRPIRVLIVDDREWSRDTIKDTIFDFDCQFSEARDGESALKHLELASFDVVFLDLQLPDISGLEVLQRARKLTTDIGNVIILTGFPEDDTRKEAEALGAFRYITKAPAGREEIRKAFTDATCVINGGASGAVTAGAAVEDGRIRVQEPPATVMDAGIPPPILPRLLVLDDDQRWLDTVQDQLGNDFDLTLTASADEACELVTTGERFDLVVLDMLLRGDNGLDVLRRLRRQVPTLRAIILTGEPPSPDSVLTAGLLGALRYVSKGASRTLSATVTEILRSSSRRIFLSYERSDQPTVSRLYDQLTDAGLLPWMDDRNAEPGSDWMMHILQVIKQSDYFVFCLSPRSAAKEGVIAEEVNQGLARQARLPVGSRFFYVARLEECEIPERLRKIQYVDLFREGGAEKLIRALTSEHVAGN